MKYGYMCKCGWYLTRRKKTRRQYAEAKRNHANGKDPSADALHQPEPCQFLKAELPKVQHEARPDS